MAQPQRAMSQLRLTGADGAAYITDASGKRLWSIEARSITITESANELSWAEISVYAKPVTE